MSLDITSLVIRTASDGIDAAANSLNKLVEAAEKAEKAVGNVGKSSQETSKTTSANVSDIDKLIQKYQKQADLLGATVAQQNAYNVAAKGGSDAQQLAASALGGQVDAYRSLAAAQKQAIAENAALDKSYKALQDQADAYYASQAKYAAQMQAMNDAGYRAQEYKKLQDAMKALEAETNALAAAEAKQKAIQQNRDIETHTAKVKALADAQKEATRINNEMTVAQERQAKASAQAFNAIGPSRENLDSFNKSGEQFINNLKAQTENLGKTAKQIREYQVEQMRLKAAQLGVTDAAEPMIQKFKDSAIHASHAASGASGIVRELIVLGHEASQGQWTRLGGSMIVLGERMDIGGKAVNYFVTAAAEAGTTVAAMLAPIAALVAVIGVVAAGFMTWKHSIDAIHEMNKELILTGNYAGTTANQLYTMSDAIGQAYGNIGKAREAATALTASGKFTAEQIESITRAAVGLYTYGGVAIEKTVAQFDKLAKESATGLERSYMQVSKAAMELDQSLHFLEPTTLKAIMDQEQLKNLQEASTIATKALAEEETKRAEKLAENLTTLGKVAHDVGSAFTNMWNNLWTKKTPQQELKELMGVMKELSDPDSARSRLANNPAMLKRDTLKRIAELTNQVLAEQNKAEEEAAIKRQNTEQNASLMYLRELHNREKGLDKFEQAKEAYYDRISKLEGTAFQVSKEQQEKDIELLKKENTEREKKAKAIGFSDINDRISAIKKEYQDQINLYNEQVVAINQTAQARKIDVMTQQSQIGELLDLKTKSLEFEQNAVLVAIGYEMQVRGRSETEKKELLNRYLQASTDFGNKISAVQKERIKNENLTAEAIAKTQAQEQSDADKAISTIQKRTNLIQAKVDAYNNLPEAVKKAGVTEKQMADEVTKAQIAALEKKRDALEELAGTTMYDSQAIANYTRKIQELQKEGEAQAQLEAQQLANKAAQEYTTAWKQTNKQIGDDLASAIIDGGGKGWKKLIKDMELAFAKLILQPILAPISAGFADMFTTTGASSSGAALKSIDVAASASKLYSSLTAGLSNIGIYVADGVQSALYAAGLSKNLLSNGSFATGAGALASVGTSAFGGLTLGNAISGGFGSNSLVNLGTGAGAVASIASSLGLIGSAGGPLTALIGGAIGGLFNRAFGMGSKNISAQGISGTIADSGVSGVSYADWTQKGGWFRSDKSGRDSSALGADVINSFTSGLTTLKATSSDFAKNLNVSSDALKDYSKSFDIQFVGLKEVKGTAAEQAAIIQSNAKIQQEAITKFFTEMGDDMATKLIPNIQEFAKSGETASVTLQRLSDVFSATNQIVEILQKDMTTAFGGIGLESAKARQYLVDLAGGISNLNSQGTYYATNFLTDAEKLAPVQKALSKAMSELGYSGVTTVDQFKALVNSLDLSTQSGAQTFEALMQLAPAFKQVTDATNAAADAAKKAAEEQAAANKAAADALFKSQKDVAQGDFNVLSKSIAKAKADAQASYDAQAAVLNAQITALQATSTSITQLVSSLDSSLNTLLTNTVMGMTQATARATLDNVLATAKATGVLPTADSLKDTLSVLSKGDSSKYSSYTDYVKDMAITAGKMAELRDLSKDQGSVVEQQLQTAKDQLDFAKQSLDAELAKYDSMLEIAQQQLDALNGSTVAIKSVAEALLAFAGSSIKAISTGISTGNLTSTAGGATQEQITSLYQTLLNRAPDVGGLQFYLNNAITKGTTAIDIAQAIMSSPEYASLHVNGSHANGLDNVPFDGYTAKLHKGEMVLPAKQAHNVAQGDDIAAVVEKLTQLCEENGAENRSINSELVKIRKILVNVTPTNDRFQVHEVGAA